jgi:hypothetical protein
MKLQQLPTNRRRTFLARLAAAASGGAVSDSGVAHANHRVSTGDDRSGSEEPSFLQLGKSAVKRSVQDKLREYISVKDYGATGDGASDDTLAFTHAIAALSTRGGGRLFVPVGTYKVSSTIDLSALKVFDFYGEGAPHGVPGQGSQIIGDFAGDLIRFTPPFLSVRFKISDLYLQQQSTDPAATTVHVNNFVGGTIENCFIRGKGKAGIWADTNTFTLNIRGCILVGDCFATPACIGIYSGSHTLIDGCDITVWGEGVRAAGAGVDIKRCRIEVNRIGLNLGVFRDGTKFQLSSAKISGNTFEANDVGIKMVSCAACVLDGVAMFGSANAPSGQSQIGIWTQQVICCAFNAWSVYGTFQRAAIKMQGGSGVSFTAQNIIAVNSYGRGSSTWDVMTGLGNAGSITFVNTNYTVRPDDTVVRGQSQRHGMFQYLSQIDYMNSNVEGKNFRGKNVLVAPAASFKRIVFTNSHSAGMAAIKSTAATTTIGASLGAGTYYYVATCVTAHGESTAVAEKIAMIDGMNNSTAIAFSANTADGFKRRVYRGTASGVYDGYWETTLNSNANFIDAGQPFDGHKSPPLGADDTSMIEPDANYAVIVTPSWLTTCRVTGKATTGFTIEFGTPTPDAGQTVDWILVR